MFAKLSKYYAILFLCFGLLDAIPYRRFNFHGDSDLEEISELDAESEERGRRDIEDEEEEEEEERGRRGLDMDDLEDLEEEDAEEERGRRGDEEDEVQEDEQQLSSLIQESEFEGRLRREEAAAAAPDAGAPKMQGRGMFDFATGMISKMTGMDAASLLDPDMAEVIAKTGAATALEKYAGIKGGVADGLAGGIGSALKAYLGGNTTPDPNADIFG